jgi:rhodanese-related sulfurtransferase
MCSCGKSKSDADAAKQGGTVQAADASKTEFKTLGDEEMVKVVESKSAVILDARSGKFDDGERIPGAIALNDNSSSEEIAKIVPDKNAAIVTYCGGTKCPASGKLASHLKKLGYTNISEYPDGIPGWKAAGRKTDKASPAK